MIVQCKKCEAIEWAYNLLTTPDYDTCPICGGREFKTITGLEGHYTQSELWDLWDCLGEVPVNDLDETPVRAEDIVDVRRDYTMQEDM